MENTIEHFHSLLDSFHSTMLVTANRDGKLCGRPMAIADLTEKMELWFITAKNSEKVGEIEQHQEVYLTFQNDNNCYLALRGSASIVNDKNKVADLWREPFRVWFPKGKDDPSIALIKVIPIEGEYWDNEGLNKLLYTFEAIKAYVKGTVPEIHEDEQHAKVHLRPNDSPRTLVSSEKV